MNEKTRKIAVITGDIVGSTALGPEKLERAMTALADCAKTQASWHGESLRFTRNRGDGWQVVLARPQMALRSALAFRATLRAEGPEFDSYFGFGVGQLPRNLKENLNEETALVFSLAGISLNNIKQTGRDIRMDLVPTSLHTAAIILADQISQKWTPAQALAISHMLAPNQSVSHTIVAKHIGKSRQAVSKALEAASEKPIQLALDAIEQGGHAGV